MTSLGLLSEAVFRGLHAVDLWAGLPRKAEESLHFRLHWRRSLPKIDVPASPSLWIHGASVGELEDLAAFFSDPALLAKSGYSADRLVLTASSVSAAGRLESWGRELGLRYSGPLPPESGRELAEFFRRLAPNLLVLSHSDLWPRALEKARLSLARGALWLPQRSPQPGFFQRACLDGLVRKVGLREPGSVDRVLGVPAVFLGNPRIDRIVGRIEIARTKPDHTLEKHGAAPEPGRVSVLIGSAWPEDAIVFQEALKILGSERAKRLQLVVMPHETRDAGIVGSIQRSLPEARVLPIEGVLLEAYAGFSVAFVGGGYHTGLHSVIEPALWGRPTLCGPDLRKQPQAPRLVQRGLLRPMADATALAAQLAALFDAASEQAAWQSATATASQELWSERGASERLAELVRSV